MRFIYLLLAAIILYGCTLEQKFPLVGEEMTLTQQEDELTIMVNFLGNDVPKETKARLILWDSKDQELYNREFFIKESEFKVNGNKTTLTRAIKLNTTETISAAVLTLFLPNGTVELGYGKKQGLVNDLVVEVRSHEEQYAIRVEVINNKKKEAVPGNLSFALIDTDGTLYQEKRVIRVGDFTNNYLLILLPYAKVPKSFYENGNVLVRFNGLEKRITIPLRKYFKEEAKQIEERTFFDHAVRYTNITEYVGFRFNVTHSGFYTAHEENRNTYVRFDATIKNLLPRPQYLIRDDFYLKDGDRTFYPVLSTKSTGFGPLIKIGEEFNASFYFDISQQKDVYYFYYGDKVIATLDKK